MKIQNYSSIFLSNNIISFNTSVRDSKEQDCQEA